MKSPLERNTNFTTFILFSVCLNRQFKPIKCKKKLFNVSKKTRSDLGYKKCLKQNRIRWRTSCPPMIDRTYIFKHYCTLKLSLQCFQCKVSVLFKQKCTVMEFFLLFTRNRESTTCSHGTHFVHKIWLLSWTTVEDKTCIKVES